MLLSIIMLTVIKCNPDKPFNQLQELERRERELLSKIDKLEQQLKDKTDTFYIEKVKLKLKNDTIYIHQSEVSNLNSDSAYQFFKQFTGSTVIHD